VGAGAERHADEGDAGVSTGAKVMGARGDRVGGGSKPPAVAPLVHRPLAWSAWRRLREGAIVLGFRGGRPVVWVRKGWKKDKEAVLVWRDSGVGVGGIVSEQRCLLSAPSKDARDALVNLSSCENGFVVLQVQGVFANALSVLIPPFVAEF